MDALKYASGIRPVFCLMILSKPSAFNSSIISEVRRHCQTTALYIGSPVRLSQRIVVSLWFVIPMAAICSGFAPTIAMHSVATAS